ncbi:MAG: ABC transporter ATP-binding protein, partial [Planctomycetota bacterium]
IDAINAFAGTVVLVTHVESVLRETCNRLVIFDEGKVRVFEGNYDDFLRRHGWSSELEERSRAANKKRGNRKDQRRERAQLIQERSRLLKPLRNEMERNDNFIDALGKKSKQTETQLIDASQQGKTNEIASLSVQLKNLQDSIEKAFQKLEEATDEHDRIQADFDARLAQEE